MAIDLAEIGRNALKIVTGDTARALLHAAIILITGLLVSRASNAALLRLLGRYLDKQQEMLLRRGVSSLVMIIAGIIGLRVLGFDLKVLLGAAGIITVAVGFASQTSASNIISGLFLIGERPFAVGDYISIGGTTGEVVAIDLMSVKLRTFDNLFVRLPNEYIIKTEITNLTYYPIRRIDILIDVAYGANIARVREIWRRMVTEASLCLAEPEPQVWIADFGDSGVRLKLCAWGAQTNFYDVKNFLCEHLPAELAAAGIAIPYPHRVIIHESLAPAPHGGGGAPGPEPANSALNSSGKSGSEPR